MEQNTVERALKTKIDAKSRTKKEWANPFGLCQKTNSNILTCEGEPVGTMLEREKVCVCVSVCVCLCVYACMHISVCACVDFEKKLCTWSRLVQQ